MLKDSIIYQDRFDMRVKIIKLLSDESLRLKCVKECQNAVEQNGRWEHRLKEIEALTRIKLLGNHSTKVPEYTIISAELKQLEKKPTFHEQKHLSYFKRIKYLLVLLLVSCLFLHKVQSCRKKVIKYSDRLYSHFRHE